MFRYRNNKLPPKIAVVMDIIGYILVGTVIILGIAVIFEKFVAVWS